MRRPTPYGKYYLLDRVNVGGMAEVFRAKATGVEGFEKLVAIKRILPNIAEDDEFITMFIDEAKIAVQLTHANIAQIYDLGKIDDSYFIALEFVPGKDLRTIFERLRKRGEILPLPLSCYVVSRVCEGLDYAHRKKDIHGQDLHIVHRDVSPQNLLVSYEGEVKIIDFGIAKAANKASKTQAGILKGKFGYMSPEQVRGLPIDRRSDVFSVGIVLYELLTGERLFVGESDFSTLEKVRNVEIMPPTTYNRRIPEELEGIVLKALSREPEERYQSAIELQEELNRFLILSGNMFSRKDLAQFMKTRFAEDIQREQSALDQFRQGPAAPSAMQIAAQTGRQPPPPPPRLPPLSEDELATRVYDPRESRPDLLAYDGSEEAGRVAIPVAADSTEPEANAPISLDTNFSGPVRMPLQQGARRRKVLVAVTLLALLGAAAVLFLYLRSVDPGRPAEVAVSATPGATIEVCEGDKCRRLGTVPESGLLRARHLAGEYRFVARKRGCADRATTLTVAAAETNPVSLGPLRCRIVAQGPGALQVLTDPPHARIRFLSSQFASWSGTSPYQRSGVPLGKYQVEVSKEGFFPRKATILARKGKAAPDRITLPARSVALRVETRPKGAKVVVRDASSGGVVARPKQGTPLWVKVERPRLDSTFTVHISRDGYDDWKGPVVFNGSRSQHLSSEPIALGRKSPPRRRRKKPRRVARRRKTPKPKTPVAAKPKLPPVRRFGTLNVNLKGAWAFVHIDGRSTGRATPLLGMRLKTGRYRITLVRKELNFRDEFYVRIAANRVTQAVREFRTRE